MKAKSIFSKIVSGVLALGMVATMLPAFSMSASAAATVTVSFGNWSNTGVPTDPDKNHVRLYAYPSNTSQLATPNKLTEIGATNRIALSTATPIAGQDNSEDLKYVILPGDYWEYTTQPSVVGFTPAADPLDPGMVNPADVWAAPTTAERNRYTIERNTADKSGRSWILTIKKDALKNTLTNLDIRISQPSDIIVSITVNVSGNVAAQETSILPQYKSEGGVISPAKTWQVKYDESHVNSTGNKGTYMVKTTDSTVWKPVTNVTKKHNDAGLYGSVNDWYSSEIMIRAEHTSAAGDFGVTVSSDNGQSGDYAKAIADESYKNSKIVNLLDPAVVKPATPANVNELEGSTEVKPETAWEWTSGVFDKTSYIGIYNLNGDFYNETAGKTYNDQKFNSTTFLKKHLPSVIDEQIWLTINPEDIYRLYVFGNADGNDGIKGGTLDDPDIVGPDFGKAKRQGGATGDWTNRYGAYKNVVINLGTSAKKGAFKIENGTAITDNVSVANMYNYSYVIRRTNGLRWDGAETEFDAYNTWSDDPAEWPLDGIEDGEAPASELNNWWRGYQSDPKEQYMTQIDGADIKEGDTISFKVMIDPTFKKGDGFTVVVRGYDNKTGQERENTPVTYDEATDTYSFVVGPYSPYRIICHGVEQQTMTMVRNIPEDREDSSYYPIPSYTPDTVTSGIASHTEAPFLLDKFYEYANRFRTYDSCNVANPRHQIFIKAHEEDDLFVDLVAFARRRAVATEAAWSGHQFPVGTHEFKVRFNNQFVITNSQSQETDDGEGTLTGEITRTIHGTFDSDVTNDRYAPGPKFKVTANDTELKADDNGVYKLTVGEDPIDLRVDGIIRAYYVFAPNLAAYDIEANYPMQREYYNMTEANVTSANFRSSVPEGSVYRFKINASDGSQKGPDFKVMLRAASDDLDTTGVMTEIKEDAEGYYSFTVNNDVEIVVNGMTGTGFNDVSNRSAEEQEAINWLRDNNVIDGYDDGSFRPGNNLTRAEFVKMLYALKGGAAGTANFSDTSGHWAAGQIGWGASQNIVNGYPDGTFKPNQSITRAEVSQVIWKLAGSQRAGLTANFADVSQSGWYAPAVNWAFEKGVVKGYGTGSFGTNDPIERAHMALILYRARGLF